MKRTRALNALLTALTLLAAPGLRAATYVQNVLDAGPAAYWRFETVNDTSLSNGFVNNFQGNATVTAAGQGVPLSGVSGNRALLLDGDGDAVRTGVSNQLTFAASGTFMAWVNFAQLPSVGNRTVELLVKSHFNSPLDWVMDANNRLYGYASDYVTVYYDFNPALATNTWYHLAFTFDNAGGFKRLYVNGVLVGDQPYGPNLTGSADEIMIGNSPVFTDRSFNGRMDEVALFNRALSSAEIQTLFVSAGVSTPAPQPAVRLNLEFPREINALERGMNEYYGLGLNFSMIPAPFGRDHALYSPHTNHSVHIGGQYGGAFNGGGWLYGSLGEAVQEATNGLWTLVLNSGATNEQIYRFKVNVSNLTVSEFAELDVTSPVDGSEGNAADVLFTWTQSKPWLLNNLELSGPSYYANVSVPPGSTTWPDSPTLPDGKYDFNLYLRTNAASWVSLTTPTNAASQALANWDAGSQLTSRRGIRFRVGYFVPPPPGLQAHLRFDDENWLGFDSSGNDHHAYISWFGEQPTYDSDGVLGGAASFTYGGWLEFNDDFTPTLGADFTVAVWVQTTQTQGNDTDDGIFGAGIVGSYVGDWSAKNTIPITINGSKAGFMTGNQDGEQTLHSTVNINDGPPDWIHVAVTRVRATGEKRIYINGVLDVSEVGNTDLLDGSNLVRIGYGGFNTYSGRLDDVQIYSAALSADDIAFLYANPGEVITSFSSLGEAVDAPELPWTTGGNADWSTQELNTHDGVDAARSGAIGDDGESWIQTTVTGPGTLSFWWNVSSEAGWDYLEFLIDDNWQDDISGDWGWDQRSYEIEAGTHTLRWRYYKDGSGSDGQDAGFLDEVSYTPTVILPPPVITLNPFNQTNRPGYQAALLAAATSSAPVAWQWFKIGSVPPIPGATNALYIPESSGTPAVAGSYFAVASSTNGATSTTAATVTFENAILPPDWSRAFRTSFTNNPANTTADINLASLFDSAGNIYTAGSITGTNVFGTNLLISINGRESSSFLKQTATGTPIWGRSMTNTGTGSSFPRGLATAPGDGIYVSGLFFGTNWLGTNRLADTAGGSTYLARFDANGSNLWVRTITGTNYNFPTHHTLVSDSAGNVTLSVLVWGDTSFGTTNLFADGQRGVLAQYDANGNVRWIQVPSAWPDYLAYSAGRIYGSMGGASTNYIGGSTNVSDRRRVLFSLNATNGQGLWLQGYSVQKDQGSPNYFGDNNATVAVAGTNVFVVGTAYGNNATFGPFSLNFPESTGQYFARYDTNGNAQVATSFGSRYTWPWAAVADSSGNVYVGCDFDTYSVFGSNLIAAPFYETVQFVGSIDVRIPGQTCVAKFDRNGNVLWARPAQSEASYLNLRDITLTTDGVWACGFFNQIGSFGTNTIYGGIAPYHRSGYLAKITDGGATPLPVTLVNATITGANFSFQFLSQAGFTHFIESRTNAAAGPWTPRTNLAGDGSLKTITLPATNAPQFFRARTQ